jgi:mono/diheme cytochrome c family protein
MDQKKTPWWLVVGGGVLVGLLLVACLALALRFTGPTVGGGYRSNGEQIYFTATSQRGTPITSNIGMGMMGGGMMTCASCHGPDGRGGRVRMMMRVFEVPDIRYQTLTSAEHGEESEGEMEHEPFTDETIKRAITEGVEPDGEPLDWPMPRWTMSNENLDDLLEFLKTLD